MTEIYVPLRRFAAVVAPPEVEPDDLLQEALLRVLRRGSLSQLDAPLAYLRRTVLNLAANERRWLARRRRALAATALSAIESEPLSYPSDLADLLSLPAPTRAAVYLADIEGYSHAEVARILGCTEATARKRTSRARKRLRTVLAGEET